MDQDRKNYLEEKSRLQEYQNKKLLLKLQVKLYFLRETAPGKVVLFKTVPGKIVLFDQNKKLLLKHQVKKYEKSSGQNEELQVPHTVGAEEDWGAKSKKMRML